MIELGPIVADGLHEYLIVLTDPHLLEVLALAISPQCRLHILAMRVGLSRLILVIEHDLCVVGFIDDDTAVGVGGLHG